MSQAIAEMNQQDYLDSIKNPLDHETNPISLSIKRAINTGHDIKLFNMTVVLGRTEFRLSEKVKNWVKQWDSENRVFQFNNFAFPPIKNLVVDFINKEVRFEGE